MATLTLTKKDGTEHEVEASTVQTAPGQHGSLTLNGIPVLAPQINLNETINPATGAAYVQVGPRPATQIQVPPMQFGRKR